jgi:hypothetical protein
VRVRTVKENGQGERERGGKKMINEEEEEKNM